MIRALNDSLVHDERASAIVVFAAPQQSLSNTVAAWFKARMPARADNDGEDFT